MLKMPSSSAFSPTKYAAPSSVLAAQDRTARELPHREAATETLHAQHPLVAKARWYGDQFVAELRAPGVEMIEPLRISDGGGRV